jgi:hypothetical protein
MCSKAKVTNLTFYATGQKLESLDIGLVACDGCPELELTELELKVERYLDSLGKIEKLSTGLTRSLNEIEHLMKDAKLSDVSVSRGRVFKYGSLTLSDYSRFQYLCYVCKGVAQAEPCPHCKGTGKILPLD